MLTIELAHITHQWKTFALWSFQADTIMHARICLKQSPTKSNLLNFPTFDVVVCWELQSISYDFIYTTESSVVMRHEMEIIQVTDRNAFLWWQKMIQYLTGVVSHSYDPLLYQPYLEQDVSCLYLLVVCTQFCSNLHHTYCRKKLIVFPLTACL